ncbi:FG-GAP-like repeat-containing protein [Terricaulis sp.]|uniref:FG-GAP-like repeat-containing protein n=1 Tax=Terricaulis sp. TaxID=2768686 RepID=UPI003782F77F
MPQYSAVIDLSALNGANGFRLDGIDVNDLSGFSVASAGDVNGDGYGDLIIGAWGGNSNAGEAYVVFGAAGGWSPSLTLSALDGSNGFRLDGIDAGDQLGSSVASAGDVNGDGFDDLIVGARFGDGVSAGVDHGETYVVFGAAGGWSAAFDLSTLDGSNGFRLDGIDANDFSGHSVASAGDVNGDGFDDLIVGARNAAPGGDSNAGETYVVFGAAGGWSASLNLATLDGSTGFRLDGIDAGDDSGWSVASAGDVNGDGFDDLIVGAHNGDPGGDSNAGEAYVVFGAADGWSASLDLSTLDGSNGFRLDGIDASDQAGYSVASAGDVNGDGFDDLIVGALTGDPGGDSNAGEIYVVFGAADGWGASFDLSTLNGSNGFRLDGIDVNDFSGNSVASAGDVNGDGFDDLIVAAVGADSFAGESYVIFGAAGGWSASLDLSALNGNNGFRIDGIDGGDRSGQSVAGAGDINGDGFDDLVVGAPYAAAGGDASAGESYIVFGSAPGEAVTRTGTAIANVIYGGTFNDTLSGLGGNDTLYGGGGVDTAVFADSSSLASWHRNADGSWTVVSSDGTDTLTGVEFLDFTDRDVHLTSADTNFSGDGTSDVLFRRTDGIVAAWSVTGTTVNATTFLPAAGADWTPLDIADVGGDGYDDVLWRRDDGTIYAWLMNGPALSGAAALAGVGAEWSFLGAGDFNGDLTDDLAWRRDDGVVYVWTMQANAVQSAGSPAAAPLDFNLEGVGDFNGDGRDDFLWRSSTTGQTVIWEMDGEAIFASGQTSVQVGLDWNVVGVGDTDGDGRDDIILQRVSNGAVRVWTMDGLDVTGSANAGAANPAQWSVRDIGDYNGDGQSDILWQRADGIVYAWFLDGASVIGSGAMAGIGAEWSIIPGG